MSRSTLPYHVSKKAILILLISWFTFNTSIIGNPFNPVKTVDVAEFYVSPTGLPSGNGSQANPWDLQTALNQPSNLTSGSTICLAPGTYHGNFTSELNGTSANPFIVKNCSGGRVIIDGSRAGEAIKNVPTLLINGGYTWFWGLEITNSDPERILTQSGSNPPERRGAGIAVFAPGIKLINLLVYDNGEGIDAWTPALDCEVYGNVVFNNGWYAPDREHGHGIYTQNNTGTKKFIDNIVLNNFSYAWQVFGSNQSTLKNFYIEGNTVFNDRWLIGGAAPMENVEVVSNYTYRDTLQIGYFSNVINNNLILRNNFLASLLKIYYWNNVTATSNTLFSGSSFNYPVLFSFEGVPVFNTFQFDSNHYYWSAPPPPSQPQPGLQWENNTLPDGTAGASGLLTLSEWQGMGKDIHGTVTTWPKKDADNMALSGSNVFVRKNRYDPKRATVTIYNWDHADAVAINVSDILSNGDTYELHNVQNYFGDVISGVYGGGLLSVSMNNHTVAKPLGYNEELGPNTFNEFGAFLLIKTSSSNSSLPVNFLSFDASAVNSHAVLSWTTADEHQVKYYIVERSTDGSRYDSIGIRSATLVPQAVNKYQFTDLLPAFGENIYRIKEVDINGRVIYSRVQRVDFKTTGDDFLVVENPVANTLRLTLRVHRPGNIYFELRRSNGQLLLRTQESAAAGVHKKELNIIALSPGTYFVTMYGDGQSITHSFIKR